jgi:hypothetical protein
VLPPDWGEVVHQDRAMKGKVWGIGNPFLGGGGSEGGQR